MKQLNLKTSILIASIYAAVFYGVMQFLNKVYPRIIGPLYNQVQINAWKAWQVWTPMILGMIAILLLGFLIYYTDWKKR
jgi:H+/gluconate symporter-like permease